MSFSSGSRDMKDVMNSDGLNLISFPVIKVRVHEARLISTIRISATYLAIVVKVRCRWIFKRQAYSSYRYDPFHGFNVIISVARFFCDFKRFMTNHLKLLLAIIILACR